MFRQWYQPELCDGHDERGQQRGRVHGHLPWRHLQGRQGHGKRWKVLEYSTGHF